MRTMRVQYITVHVINNYGLNQSLRRIITETKEIDPKRTNPTSDESKPRRITHMN